MREYLLAIWGGALLTQAALSFALLADRTRGLPRFTEFIVVDFLRWSLLMFIVWKYGMRTQYGYAFLFSEPFSMILLACAGIEAFGRNVNEHPPLSAYTTIIVAGLLIGAALPHHELQTRTTPTIYEIAMNKMFMQRALFAFCTVALLLVSSAWHEKLPDAHGIILFCFCVFDLVTYLSLTIYPQWAKARPLDAPMFVMSGQTACLMAWVILFTARTRAEEIS